VDLNHDRTSQLSLGLSAALSQTSIDAQQLRPHEYEPLLEDGFNNATYVPDAVLGAVYRYKSSYVGLTASNLFQRSIKFRNEFDYDYVMYRHYFLMAGSTVEFNNNFLFSPSLLAKVTSNGVYQAEISTMLAYRDDVWLAFSYRTPSIASAMLGFRAGKVYVGYAYEYNFNSIRTISKGSQELVLMYRIGDPIRRYRWGNRF
jgi:type IX secretion system PorP/SprF family membrane protein